MNKLLKWLLLGSFFRMYAVDDEGGGAAPATTDDGDVIGTGNDARVALLERINDANDAERADELAAVNDDGSTEQFVPENPPADAPDVEPQDAAAPTEELPRTFKVKINGKERELTEAEVLARAQKVEAADSYLAEAARLRTEAERRLAAAVQQQQQNTQPQPSQQDVAARLLEERRALVRAIQMGTEDEAMVAIDRLQQMNRAPSVTTDDVNRTIDERLTFKEAVSLFQRNYQDVLGDPELKAMALRKDNELLAAGDRRSYWERYQAIGNEVRAWRDRIVQANAPASVASPQQEKQNRKAATPAAPRTANVKAPAPVAPDEREETVADVIAAMAKSRGGPQWLRS